MADKTVCFQREQAEGIAALQDKLTGALIGVARAAEGNMDLVNDDTHKLILEGLSATVSNGKLNDEIITELIGRAEDERKRLVPSCFYCTASCGRNDVYDMQNLWNADKEIRSLKSLILSGIRGMAPYACQTLVSGCSDPDVNKFFYRALFAVGMDDWGMEELLPVALELGEVSFRCRELLG